MVEYEVGNCPQKVAKAPTDERPLEILFHDESAFQTHDAQEKSWVLDSQHQPRKKGVGRGIHRSDFIGPTGGWCKEAGVQIKYGQNHDGYWTGEDVCNQLKEKAIPALEK
jgi:hypothetical protein